MDALQLRRSVSRCWHAVGFLVGVALLASVVGCGSDTAQVRGHVTYEDGSPVEGAIRVIRFEPTDDSTAVVRKVASGKIDTDGNYELMTQRPGDGTYKGKYKVTFTVLESPQTGVSLIRPEYTMAETTPFEVTVGGSDSDFDFQLKKL